MNEEQKTNEPPQLPKEPFQGWAPPEPQQEFESQSQSLQDPNPEPRPQPSDEPFQPLEPSTPSRSSDPNRRWSAGEILAGVINTPKQTMAYVGETRPLKLGLATYFGVLLFSVVVSALTVQNMFSPEQMKILSQAIGGNSEEILSSFLVMGQVLALLIKPLFFFMGAAVYNLLGELFGGRSDGKGLLAALGLAQLPGILLPPFQLIASFTLGSDLVLAASLVVLLWTLVLDVMAIRFSLKLSWGRAFATLIMPFVTLFVVLFVSVFIFALFTSGAI